MRSFTDRNHVTAWLHPEVHASIVIGGKDKARALEGTRPVLPEIVRSEIAQDVPFILMGDYWQTTAYRNGLTGIIRGCLTLFTTSRAHSGPSWAMAADA